MKKNVEDKLMRKLLFILTLGLFILYSIAPCLMSAEKSEVIAKYLKIAKNDAQDLIIRGYAIKKLAKIGDSSVVPDLIELLNQNQDLWADLCYALGELGDTNVIPFLVFS